VSFAWFLDGRSTRHPRFEVSQFPLVIGDGCIGGGQERSELRASQQRTFNLQAQPPAFGVIGQFTFRVGVASRCALFQIAHRFDALLIGVATPNLQRAILTNTQE
jgi:hypothetical protein